MNTTQRLWLKALSLVVIFGMPTAQADIQVLSLNDYQVNQQLVLDATIDINLAPLIIEAVNHEVPLTFTTEIELNERYSLLGIDLSRNRVKITYESQVNYFGFNKIYVISNKRNQKVQSFSSLYEALKTMGTLSSFYLANLADLHPNTLYTIKIRVALNQWKLPTPLILDALWKSDWQLDSGWHQTQIQSPKSWQ